MFWNVGCRVSMLGVLMMMIGGGDGPSRMAGHAMIDEPMYLGGNPTR
jgi:hypothetical protein